MERSAGAEPAGGAELEQAVARTIAMASDRCVSERIEPVPHLEEERDKRPAQAGEVQVAHVQATQLDEWIASPQSYPERRRRGPGGHPLRRLDARLVSEHRGALDSDRAGPGRDGKNRPPSHGEAQGGGR